MNKNDQNFIAQRIRAQYTEKNSTELDALKALDARVKKPANVFGYTFGSISTVIMGSGMSLVMTDIGEKIGMSDAMIPGILIGVIGLTMVLITYPIYKKILDSRKRRYSAEILSMSESIMNK